MAYPVQADPTAVFGRRVLAALLDALLVLVPAVMLATSEFEYFTAQTLDAQGIDGTQFCDGVIEDNGICVDLTEVEGMERVYFADGTPGSATAYYWLANIGLLVVLQGLTGWTPGKLLTGIRVVRDDGRPAGIGRALLRWLLWVVDGFPYVVPLVGFIVGLTTVGHRRVGDMVAKTLVVRASAAGTPISVPGLSAPPPPGAVGAGWASPLPPPPSDLAPSAPPADRPHWDDARGTYIQWDPTEQTWMQWDEGGRSWSPIPGQ